MRIHEEYAKAINDSNTSPQEFAWGMKCTMERLNELLDGKQPTDAEELEMFRVVWKTKNKINAKQE